MSVNNHWKKTIYIFVSSIHQAPTMFQVLRIQKRKRHGWSLLSENSQFLAKIQVAHPCNSIDFVLLLGLWMGKVADEFTTILSICFKKFKSCHFYGTKVNYPRRQYDFFSCGKGTALTWCFWNISSIMLSLESELLPWSVVESVERVVVRYCNRAGKSF